MQMITCIFHYMHFKRPSATPTDHAHCVHTQTAGQVDYYIRLSPAGAQTHNHSE